jgi:hypothetical protein
MGLPRIIEDPYLPPGFIAMADREGVTILNSTTGYSFRIPPITMELKMSTEFKRTDTGVTGYILAKFQLGR